MEFDRQRILLHLDATRPVADAATELRLRFVLLSRATCRAIEAHKGEDLDTGPLWVRRGSLQHLDSMLVGYAVACDIHDSDESFDFWNSGPFSQWLWKRMNMAYPSDLGWAVEIERAAESAGTPPMEMFFSLLDEFRAERGRPQSTQER
ncbi:hypothetical protein ACFC5Z_22200 [Streptomyces sp. NPDC056004]|uniref:hypothetical protein n=1 Tax=Streptomyces sp. NPDC056004 TaxID=3345677 RepID=UPI0035DFF001